MSATGLVAGPVAGGRALPVALVLARRALNNTLRIPATVVPIVVMPLFFVLAFGGAFSAVTRLPVFPTENILDWMAPFAALQGAAFAGFGTAFGAGRDLENGFYDRLLAAPVNRIALGLGPLLYSASRSLVPVVIVVPVALLGGATLPGGVVGLALLVAAAVGVAVAAGLWGLGVVYRTRTQRAGGLIQAGIFVVLFLSIGMVPLDAMEGTWLYHVARYNPYTQVLEMARAGFLGQVSWSQVWPGLLALSGAIAGLSLFARRGFARLEN